MRAEAFAVRTAVKRAFARMGFELRRVRSPSQLEGIGDMRACLGGLRARGLECRSILDVGANRGDWARLARRVFPAARVTLIEPLAEMRPYLDALCAEDAACRWVLAGAGSRPGQLDLAVADDLVGSSFLPSAAGSPDPTRSRRVPVVTVDSLLEDGTLDPPQLVKLDVQGFEVEVLAGAERLFGLTEAFVLEVSLFAFHRDEPVLGDVVAFMAERGYAVYDVAGFVRRPLDGALGQLDLCFARDDGVLRARSEWEAPSP